MFDLKKSKRLKGVMKRQNEKRGKFKIIFKKKPRKKISTKKLQFW